jgi:hypothetical protein
MNSFGAFFMLANSSTNGAKCRFDEHCETPMCRLGASRVDVQVLIREMFGRLQVDWDGVVCVD